MNKSICKSRSDRSVIKILYAIGFSSIQRIKPANIINNMKASNMGKEIIKGRISNYTTLVKNTINRILETCENVNLAIKKFGLTQETYALAVNFHQMKVDELKLLDIVLSEVIANFNKLDVDDFIFDMIDELKIKSNESITDAEQELKEIWEMKI